MLIEIFSDVVCPWCYIGKRRLDAVLAGWPDHGIEIRWRAFQLYPMLPPDGVPREDFMRARFGAGAEVGRIYARIREEAAPLGLELEFERIERAPNTLRAHRLLAWAGERSGAVESQSEAKAGGAQHRLAEALFRAYFTAGRDLCDPEVLADAAVAAGIERTEALDAIAQGAGAAAVEADLQAAEEAEITGVPLYVLGGRFAIPGAQPTDVLRQFIERARAKLA